jgi:DNA-binding cell septation regulator SpoVG
MTKTVRLITGVGFTPGTARDQRDGLIGYVKLTFAELLLLDGLTVRKTEAGHYALSFPGRTDSRGHRHPYSRPQDDRARRLIEDAVFQALGIEGDAQEAGHG